MSSRGDVSTELARERSRAAADRTLMAWIRTCLSLIGFGFTIAKGYDYLEATQAAPVDSLRTPLIFGGSFIVLGMLALVTAIIQHVNILSQIREQDYTYGRVRPITLVVAIILVCIGGLAFGAIFL
jgi:putative membrane protein